MYKNYIANEGIIKSPHLKVLIMLKFIIVLILLGSTQLSAGIKAQVINLNSRSVHIKEVITSLGKQSGYHFLYLEDDLKSVGKISVQLKNSDLKTALDEVLVKNGLSFSISGKRILIEHNKAQKKATPESLPLIKQQEKIQGKIKDKNGLPLAGVTIRSSNGQSTSSDERGDFHISSNKADKIVFEFIGYETQTLTVDDRTNYTITLSEIIDQLDEVVVVGYGTQKKANLTGATATVQMDKTLGNRPVSSLSDALVGAIPGLQITKTAGEPGASSDLTIRGATGTINGNGGKPLILINNVEMDLDLINPEDIESVTVLKDAASAAVYGARAAFGVILITTKKGLNDDRFLLDFSTNTSLSKPYDLPKKATPFQTVKMYKDAGLASYVGGENIDRWLELLSDYESQPSIAPEGHLVENGVMYNLANRDMFKDMMQGAGVSQINNLSAYGGNNNISYRLGLGYNYDNGVLITDKDSYQRYNVSAFVRSQALSWLIPELDIRMASGIKKFPTSDVPYGIWTGAVSFPSYTPLGEALLDGNHYPYFSPRTVIENAFPTTNKTNNIRASGNLYIKPFAGFNITTQYTIDKKFGETDSFNPIWSYIRYETGLQKSTTAENQKFQHVTDNTVYSALNIFGDYSAAIGDHHMKFMVGFNQEHFDWSEHLIYRTNIINQNLPSISGAVGETFADDSFSEYSIRGGFYRVNYDYQGKYLFETNARYDGSSKFAKKSRFGFFPSVSGGWRLSEESFMRFSKKILSEMKIRASWGNIGNQNIDPYAYIPGMSTYNPEWLVNGKLVYSLKMPSLVSQSFTWEKVQTTNLGLDLGFLNNSVNLVFDWYQRDTKGMLAAGAELPAVLGDEAPLQNSADLATKGWDLAINYRGQSGQLKYTIGANLFDSNTKITKFNNASGLLTQYYVGQNINEQWGYITDRFYQDSDFENGKLKAGIPAVEGYSPNPGDILYVDLNGDGIINAGQSTLDNSGDRVILGNRTRRFQYGINGSLDWKNFTFSFIVNGIGKRDLWYNNELFWPWQNEYSTLMSHQTDYWTPDNKDAYYPKVYEKAKGNSEANRLIQTKYKLNGAFFNLRNISLSYKVPLNKLDKNILRMLTVFAGVENALSFNHLPDGMDPEASSRGGGWNYPFMRQYSFGLKAGF